MGFGLCLAGCGVCVEEDQNDPQEEILGAGISATTTASRVMKCERLEGSSVQHHSVAGVDSNSVSLTPSSLFKHSATWQKLFWSESTQSHMHNKAQSKPYKYQI